MRVKTHGAAAGGSEHRAGSLVGAVGLTLVLMLALQLVAWLQATLFGGASDRSLALLKIGGAVVAEVGVIALAVLLFRRYRVPLFEVPFREWGRRSGWVAAGAVWLLWALPLLGRPPAGIGVLEVSGFNIVGSLLAGPGAGAAEEVIFRGLLMSLLAWGGWRIGPRVAIAALMFGLAHAGWGILSGEWRLGLFAMIGTTVLGLVLGVVYALSGRRLLPPLVLHAAINLVIEPWLVLGAISGNLTLPGS